MLNGVYALTDKTISKAASNYSDMETFTTERFHLTSPNESNDVSLFNLLLTNEARQTEPFFTNFRSYYEVGDLQLFIRLRNQLSRKMIEGQVCLLDISTICGDFIGCVGFVKDLTGIITAVCKIAVLSKFRIGSLRVEIPSHNQLFEHVLKKMGFFRAGQFQFILVVQEVLLPSFDSTKRVHVQDDEFDKDSADVTTGAKSFTCVECGELFHMSFGEMKFYYSKGMKIPLRCVDCRRTKSLKSARVANHSIVSSFTDTSFQSPLQYVVVPSRSRSFATSDTSPSHNFAETSPRRDSQVLAVKNATGTTCYHESVSYAESPPETYSIHNMQAGRTLESNSVKLCPFWLHGQCRFGSNCRHSHGYNTDLPLLTPNVSSSKYDARSTGCDRNVVLNLESGTNVKKSQESVHTSTDCNEEQTNTGNQKGMSKATAYEVPPLSTIVSPVQNMHVLLLDMLNTASTTWLLMLRYRESPHQLELTIQESIEAEGSDECNDTTTDVLPTKNINNQQSQSCCGIKFISSPNREISVADGSVDQITTDAESITETTEWKYFSVASVQAIVQWRAQWVFIDLDALRAQVGLERLKVDNSLVSLNQGVVYNYQSQRQILYQQQHLKAAEYWQLQQEELNYQRQGQHQQNFQNYNQQEPHYQSHSQQFTVNLQAPQWHPSQPAAIFSPYSFAPYVSYNGCLPTSAPPYSELNIRSTCSPRQQQYTVPSQTHPETQCSLQGMYNCPGLSQGMHNSTLFVAPADFIPTPTFNSVAVPCMSHNFPNGIAPVANVPSLRHLHNVSHQGHMQEISLSMACMSPPSAIPPFYSPQIPNKTMTPLILTRTNIPQLPVAVGSTQDSWKSDTEKNGSPKQATNSKSKQISAESKQVTFVGTEDDTYIDTCVCNSVSNIPSPPFTAIPCNLRTRDPSPLPSTVPTHADVDSRTKHRQVSFSSCSDSAQSAQAQSSQTCASLPHHMPDPLQNNLNHTQTSSKSSQHRPNHPLCF